MIPAYEAVNNSSRLSQRIWEILMLGVSTRKYASVLPAPPKRGETWAQKTRSLLSCVFQSTPRLAKILERPTGQQVTPFQDRRRHRRSGSRMSILTSRLSISATARLTGRSRNTVARWLERHYLAVRSELRTST